MKLIYLHLYKDIYLIFMQAYSKSQSFLNYSKLSKGKNLLSIIKSFTNS